MTHPSTPSLLALCLLLLLAANAVGQTTITGTVNDADSQPIVSGNVLVVSLPDSQLVTGEAFWDGSFTLSYPSSTTGLLKVTALGMRDTLIALSAIDASSRWPLPYKPTRWPR